MSFDKPAVDSQHHTTLEEHEFLDKQAAKQRAEHDHARYQNFLIDVGEYSQHISSSQTFTQNFLKVATGATNVLQAAAAVMTPGLAAGQVVHDAYRLKTATTSKAKRAVNLGVSVASLATGTVAAVAAFHVIAIGAVAAAPLTATIVAGVAAIRSGFLLSRSLRKSAQQGLLSDRNGSIEKLEVKLGLQNQTVAELSEMIAKTDHAEVQRMRDLYRLRRLKLQAEALAEDQATAPAWKKLLHSELLDYQRDKAKNRGFDLATAGLYTAGFAMLCVPPLAIVGGALLVAASALLVTRTAVKYCTSSFNQWRTGRAQERLNHVAVNMSEAAVRDRCLQHLGVNPAEGLNFWRGLPPEVRYQKYREQILKDEAMHCQKENRGRLILQWYAHEMKSPPSAVIQQPARGFLGGLVKGFAAIGWGIKKIAMALLAPVVASVAGVYSVVDYGVGDQTVATKATPVKPASADAPAVKADAPTLVHSKPEPAVAPAPVVVAAVMPTTSEQQPMPPENLSAEQIDQRSVLAEISNPDLDIFAHPLHLAHPHDVHVLAHSAPVSVELEKEVQEPRAQAEPKKVADEVEVDEPIERA